MAFLQDTIKNKTIHFIGSRYATYFIQFINSIFIAVYLGPYYLGVWGFITLIVQYLNQFNFGIAHSVNAIIAINSNKQAYIEKVVGTAFLMFTILSFFVLLFFLVVAVFDIELGSKYNFPKYGLLVAGVGILAYYNSLFSNVFRVKGRLYEIAINQSSFPLMMLVAILLFKGEDLLWALLWANFFAFFLSFCLYIFRSPIKFKVVFIWKLMKSIQIKGWHLFIYNSSFYLIIISTRTFVSWIYSVEQFGYFTFAFSLANVVQLLLQSFAFLIFPKMIKRLAFASKEKSMDLIQMMRDLYATTSHLLIHISIFVIPFFIFFFPQYKPAEQAFRLIGLTVVLMSNSFGYSGLLIAKGYERKLGQLSFLILVLNIFLLLAVNALFQLPFYLVIISTIVSYSIYIFLLNIIGRKKLEFNTSFINVIKDSFPLKLFIPYFLSFYLIVSSASIVFFILPILLFVLLNITVLKKIKGTVLLIVTNPDIINV